MTFNFKSIEGGFVIYRDNDLIAGYFGQGVRCLPIADGIQIDIYGVRIPIVMSLIDDVIQINGVDNNGTQTQIIEALTSQVFGKSVGGGATGTVTSVGLSAPTGLSVSGSPITTAGTLALTLSSGYTIPTIAALNEKANNTDVLHVNGDDIKYGTLNIVGPQFSAYTDDGCMLDMGVGGTATLQGAAGSVINLYDTGLSLDCPIDSNIRIGNPYSAGTTIDIACGQSISLTTGSAQPLLSINPSNIIIDFYTIANINSAPNKSLVTKEWVNSKIPIPPTTGTFVLKSVDGVVSWVTE